jgi:hypothetical protein
MACKGSTGDNSEQQLKTINFQHIEKKENDNDPFQQSSRLPAQFCT